MIDTTARLGATTIFEEHPARGRLNAAFFGVIGPYLERTLRPHKERVYADLPTVVVEIGPGVGANLRYLPYGATLVALEPNPHMHRRLRVAALRSGVRLDLRERSAEDSGLPDQSADCVISSLVLCSVRDPEAVLAEVRRILRPGGAFRFAEHVAAREGTVTRVAQRVFRRPWGWLFEGCSCERGLEQTIRRAGFHGVSVERYRLHTPFLPFNTHIAGVATA